MASNRLSGVDAMPADLVTPLSVYQRLSEDPLNSFLRGSLRESFYRNDLQRNSSAIGLYPALLCRIRRGGPTRSGLAKFVGRRSPLVAKSGAEN